MAYRDEADAFELAAWEDQLLRDYGDRPASDSEAHAEWHLNAGHPMDMPGCPWDCCDGPSEGEARWAACQDTFGEVPVWDGEPPFGGMFGTTPLFVPGPWGPIDLDDIPF